MKTIALWLLTFLGLPFFLIAQDISNIIPDTVENGYFKMNYGGIQISGYFENYKMTGNWITAYSDGKVHIIENYKDG
ncbi:MAG TPA: hypothetical protein VIN10_13315, partial [Bacteroidales bacterium]